MKTLQRTVIALLVIACMAAAPTALEAQEKRPDGATKMPASTSFVNVRLELAITDKTGEGEPVRKTVTLLVAEKGQGRVRSSGTVFREATATDRRSAFEVTLNADAFIHEIAGDRIFTGITVEYAPSAEGSGAGNAGAREQRGSTLNQSVSVVLTNGKPTVIVESSDPLSDRKVTLEATATIQR